MLYERGSVTNPYTWAKYVHTSKRTNAYGRHFQIRLCVEIFELNTDSSDLSQRLVAYADYEKGWMADLA